MRDWGEVFCANCNHELVRSHSGGGGRPGYCAECGCDKWSPKNDPKRPVEPCETCGKMLPELRRKTTSNGTHQVVWQCRHCGRDQSSALPLAIIKDVLALPAYEKGRLNEYWADRIETRNAIERSEWRQQHDEYCQTEKWRSLRKRVMERSKGLCEGCRERPATIVHHLTYKHWRNELLFELVAVCEGCHEKAHPEHHEQRA